jgi:U3 small nucleolar RNA-associated protein 14
LPRPNAKAVRGDRALPLVLINEKRVKAAARLKVEEVPYPFTSREQYERSLAVPIGKEWNGMRAARGFARPQVVTDAGKAIKPIKLAQKKAQHQAPLARAR